MFGVGEVVVVIGAKSGNLQIWKDYKEHYGRLDKAKLGECWDQSVAMNTIF